MARRHSTARFCKACGAQYKAPIGNKYYRSRACYLAAGAHCRFTVTKDDVLSLIDRNGPNGCWLWLGYRETLGYGRINYQGRRWLAHRIVYHLLKNQLVDGIVLDHACVNPPCVNPQHMIAGTQKDNVRAAHRRRTHCVSGRHELTDTNKVPGTQQCIQCMAERVSAKRGVGNA